MLNVVGYIYTSLGLAVAFAIGGFGFALAGLRKWMAVMYILMALTSISAVGVLVGECSINNQLKAIVVFLLSGTIGLLALYADSASQSLIKRPNPVEEYVKRAELREPRGELLPGNWPPPINSGGYTQPPGFFSIIGGDCGVSIEADSPVKHVGFLSVFGKERISIDKGDNGGIFVNATIYDSKGNLAVRIVKNEFERSPLTFASRPDASTLIVYDQSDLEILYVRYLNKNAVRIRGVVQVPGSLPIYITDDKIKVGLNSIQGLYIVVKTDGAGALDISYPSHDLSLDGNHNMRRIDPKTPISNVKIPQSKATNNPKKKSKRKRR